MSIADDLDYAESHDSERPVFDIPSTSIEPAWETPLLPIIGLVLFVVGVALVGFQVWKAWKGLA